MSAPSPSAPSGPAKTKYKIHWHVLLTHFPISAFLGAFTFMVLHLFSRNNCYTLAAYVSLISGTLVMVPATVSGWITWKRRYKGVKGQLFLAKIRISYAMIALSIALVIYQTVYPFDLLDIWHSLGHFLYFAGVTLLLLGAGAEGYFGGRLHHR